MQKYRAKTYSELDLNERGKLEIRKRNENQRNDLVIKFTMKRKSQSINSSSDTYYADENIKRPKQEIRKRSSQTSSEVKERKKLYMRVYRLKKKNSDSSVMTEGVTSLKNGVSSQEMYLSEFKISNYGELHQQEWAKLNMQKFHDSMKLRISLCQCCHEAWPLHIKTKKKKEPYICTRCLRDTVTSLL